MYILTNTAEDDILTICGTLLFRGLNALKKRYSYAHINISDKAAERGSEEMDETLTTKTTETLIYNRPITGKNILNFTIPTMVRMLFVSMYSIVDGIVVSNYIGSLGLSAINIVYPVLNISMAITFVFSMGGNALIGKKLGEGKRKEACSFFSLIMLVNLAVMAVMVFVFLMWGEEIYLRIGADAELLPYCIEYGTVMVLAGPIWSLQIMFQSFLVTADKPHVGLWLSVGAGVLNIVLDILLVGYLDCGIAGAAYASMAGMCVAGLLPLFIFFNSNSLLHFEKPMWRGRDLLYSMANGASEMVSSFSSAIITALFNLQMMHLVGEKGVAAISAILYLQFVFVAILIGFSSGIAPLFSYHYGAGNKSSIQKLFRISMYSIVSVSVLMLLLGELFDKPLVMIFASKDAVLADLMIGGFRIVAVSFLFSGISIFASGFFTALNNGKISALISFLRTLVLEVGMLLLLPWIFDLNGVWWALPAAEILSAIMAVGFLMRYRKVYGY